MTNTTNRIHTTVISHVNCTDGMMAAYLLWHYVKYFFKRDMAGYEFLFCQYNKPVPVMQGKAVIVADFSFTPEELEHENFKDKHITMLDHHDSAAKKYGGYGRYSRQCCDGKSFMSALFEEHKSGAGLMYEYLYYSYSGGTFNNYEVPERIKYLVARVQDRDLWNFGYEDTRAVYELLNSIPATFEAWDELITNTSEPDFNTKLLEAKIRTDMRLELARSYANLAIVAPYGDRTVAIVNCPANFASEVGDILGKKHAFAVMFLISPKDQLVIASLRSNKETGVDVSKIAGYFGGGGHKNAAGMSFRYMDDHKHFGDFVSGELFTLLLNDVD